MLNKVSRLCLSFPGATENIQWGNDRVFKVAGKMFLCMGTEPNSGFSFKADDDRFLELTDLPGIDPAPYLARARWVRVEPAECPLPYAELKPLVRRSYELVFARLTRKARQAILDQEPT